MRQSSHLLSDESVRIILHISLILAQALLPVLGHSHDESHHGDQIGHGGFHVHFDWSQHHFHAHDANDEDSEPGFSERSETTSVAYLNFSAWEVIRFAGSDDGVDVAAFSTVADQPELWFEWPPAPVSKPPTSAWVSAEIPIYLSLCSLLC